MKRPSSAQLDILWTALTALAVISLVGVMALTIYALILLLSWSYPILLPVGLAMLVSLFLEPAVGFFHKRGLNRVYATLAVFLLGFLLLALFLPFLFPLLNVVFNFFASLPKNIGDVLNNVNSFFLNQTAASSASPATPATPPVVPQAESFIAEWLQKNRDMLQTEVPQRISTFLYSLLAPLGSAFSFIFGFAFVPIYVFYFLTDKETIAEKWKDYVPLRQAWWRDEIVGTLSEINDSLVNYLRGQIIVAMVNGILTCIGLTLIGVPYSLVLGVMAGALSIVPFLGIIVSILPAILLAFLPEPMFGFWWLRPLLVLTVFAMVQMVESVFVTPRVQSQSTGLHPLAIILGILFWSMVLPGLLGPVLAVPLTSAVVVVLRRYVWQVKPDAKSAAVTPKAQA